MSSLKKEKKKGAVSEIVEVSTQNPFSAPSLSSRFPLIGEEQVHCFFSSNFTSLKIQPAGHMVSVSPTVISK